MKREEILLKMKAQINQLNSLKKEYTYHENIDKHIKDIRNIIKVISDNGNLQDIQKVTLYNLPAYFKMNIPKNMSIKQFMDINKNDISVIEGIQSFGVYAGDNSITAKFIWIKPI